MMLSHRGAVLERSTGIYFMHCGNGRKEGIQ